MLLADRSSVLSLSRSGAWPYNGNAFNGYIMVLVVVLKKVVATKVGFVIFHVFPNMSILCPQAALWAAWGPSGPGIPFHLKQTFTP